MLVEHRTIWMEHGNVAAYALPRAYLCSACHVITLVKSGAHKGPRNCPNCKTPGEKMSGAVEYTVLFKHTCPHRTWGEDPGNAGYPEEFRSAKVYGEQAGKPISEQLFMMVVTAADPLEAKRRAEADAMDGWGTIVFLVFEGALVPAIKDDLVTELGRESP